ncbi:unnamed protein product [Allacma fusca]|uniref:Uncharacterized protein n=1 Tax=Allacma fusca TaxID=39272 RepID=A0A8J2NY17_9HEXA|nr:unnamed protein product [Allacma fusca]
MVQGEKQSTMMSVNGSSSRTTDPAARKASYEAVQKMEKTKTESWSNKSSNASKSSDKGQQNQNGSWGPIFKNKSNFTEMHWC